MAASLSTSSHLPTAGRRHPHDANNAVATYPLHSVKAPRPSKSLAGAAGNCVSQRGVLLPQLRPFIRLTRTQTANIVRLHPACQVCNRIISIFLRPIGLFAVTSYFSMTCGCNLPSGNGNGLHRRSRVRSKWNEPGRRSPSDPPTRLILSFIPV